MRNGARSNHAIAGDATRSPLRCADASVVSVPSERQLEIVAAGIVDGGAWQRHGSGEDERADRPVGRGRVPGPERSRELSQVEPQLDRGGEPDARTDAGGLAAASHRQTDVRPQALYE